jgi:dihydrofolate reductase
MSFAPARSLGGMTFVKCRLAISLDGFSSAPGQSLEEPFGPGGERLTTWMFEAGKPGREADARLLETVNADVGAYIMGRHMFGGYAGPWDESWRGWWEEDPPFHCPVFVLTHHERESLQMEGGTTFHFVTDGIESAMKQAQAAAGERPVAIAGGATTVRQYLAADLIDELVLHVVPVVLGDGERIWDGLSALTAEPVEVIPSPTVTHVRYRIAGH